jgi:hypothetical protein
MNISLPSNPFLHSAQISLIFLTPSEIIVPAALLLLKPLSISYNFLLVLSLLKSNKSLKMADVSAVILTHDVIHKDFKFFLVVGYCFFNHSSQLIISFVSTI